MAQLPKNEKGSAIAEFALVLMPVMGCVFLLFQIAWIVFAWACVQEGVREGVRYAVTCAVPTGLNASIQAVVQQYSFGFVTATHPAQVVYKDPITFDSITPPIRSGDVVNVGVTGIAVYMFAPLLHEAIPIYISAKSADIMSCPTPATP